MCRVCETEAMEEALAAIARKILADDVLTSLVRDSPDGGGQLAVDTSVELTPEEADAAERFIDGLIPGGVTLYNACASGNASLGQPLQVRAIQTSRYPPDGLPAPMVRALSGQSGDVRAWAEDYPSQEEALAAAAEAVRVALAERAAAREPLAPEAQARSIAEHAGWLRETEGRGF